jgi:hypothetical protein
MDKNVKVIALSSGNTGSDRAINFMEGLSLLFIGLKLGGKLEDWTWIEALSPIWLPIMVNWLFFLIKTTILPPWLKKDEDKNDE